MCMYVGRSGVMVFMSGVMVFMSGVACPDSVQFSADVCAQLPESGLE